MACWSHQSRNTKALRCCQTNGLASTGYVFETTAISPVNSTYASERTNLSSARARGRVPIAAVCAQADAEWTPAQPKHNLRQHTQFTGTARGRQHGWHLGARRSKTVKRTKTPSSAPLVSSASALRPARF